jgi:ArsR family transcriptional regulator, arsenate/arsenite/antimonite-responsive transcriptional repressor
MQEASEIFKALGDPTRLRILRLLIQTEAELCCCELTDSLQEPQYAISRHLKALKQAGLIEIRKESRWVYSRLARQPDRFRELILQAVQALSESDRLMQDRANLDSRLALRLQGRCVLGAHKPHTTIKSGATRR